MRMGIKSQVYAMTRNTTWITPEKELEADTQEAYCVNNCPHKDKECKGNCKEVREFAKTHPAPRRNIMN
jgi:hypothetical protein